jgi:hypothetical protein
LAIGTLAASCLGAVAWTWQEQQRQSWSVVWRASWLVPMAAFVLMPETSARASLSAFSATDALDELRVRVLPPRAVVLESAPQTVFRSFELSAVEGARPDVVHVPLPFLRYPNAAQQLIARQPALAAVVSSFQVEHDQLRQAAPLLTLARARPLFVELDTRVDPALYPILVPRGIYAQVGEPVPAIQTQAQLEHFYLALRAGLGAQQHETETSRQLLWMHYMNALQLGALGQTTSARAALTQALALQPTEHRLIALQAALETNAPLDISAFLTF